MVYDPGDGRYDRACLNAFIECLNYHPTGNCSHPRWIRLRTEGLEWQAAEIVTALKRLTHLPQKTRDGTGDLKVPLTWAMVTQLSKLMEERHYGWVPDPGLNRWIYGEFMRRHAEFGSTEELFFPVGKLDWTPMPHQLAGMYLGALNKRFFFCDDMRTGKTRTALLTLAELEARGENPFPAFVICPASVMDSWMEELEAAFPDWPAVQYAGTKRRNLSSRYKIYVMSWNTFTRDMKHEPGDLPPLLRFLAPRTVVMDEAHALCLRSNTKIETISGSKAISEVHEGDFVLGVDHGTGRDVWTRVNAIGRSPLRATVKLGRLELTPDHPVWVSDSGRIGYATSYAQDIRLRPLRELVRTQELPESAAEVLLPVVRKRKEGRGNGGGSFTLGNSGSGSGGPAQPREVAHGPGNAGVPGIGSQSIQGQGRRSYQGTGARDGQEAWVSGAEGRERGAYYPAGAVAEAARLGVHPRVLSEPGSAATGLPDVLQGGSRLPSAEAGRGTGREFAPLEAAASPGRQEGREVGVTWLGSAEVLEYGSPEESLWNLSTDTGNYVAAGILVHNCNVKTKQSVAASGAGRVADYAFLMSGTPITRDVGGFWRSVSILDTRSFTDPDRYKERYTDRFHNDYGQDTIDGLKPATLEEFHLLMKGSMRRVAKRDVNPDLLPPCYSTRVVHIPPAYRAAYDEMAADMLAHIPDTDEPLEVMTTLAQLQRLTQLASSACDVEIEMVIEERINHPMFGQPVPRQHVTMREPSWKIDELMAVMDENQGTGNPLVAFSPHTQLVKLAGARAERAGYRVGYITGQETKKQKTAYRHAFQGGDLDLMCCNITAGGVGLTLNRGDTVIFLERSWAYWQNHQAEARVDDIINAQQVYVIDIVAAGTVESRVRLMLKDKAKQLSELVRDPRIVEELLGGQPLNVK